MLKYLDVSHLGGQRHLPEGADHRLLERDLAPNAPIFGIVARELMQAQISMEHLSFLH
jgi:hypothetical protein